MTAPGRSTFTQSGLIELGKPIETLPDGQFVEAKKPREPRKKKNAEPEIPQPFVGPPPVISGAGKPRGAKASEGPEKPLQVFQAVAASSEGIPAEAAPVGQAVSGVAKTRKTRFAKGSEEAKKFMADLRAKAVAKRASAPAAGKVEKAVKAAVAAIPVKKAYPAEDTSKCCQHCPSKK
jgi:hypothetical protein